jgi:hypothetical protein
MRITALEDPENSTLTRKRLVICEYGLAISKTFQAWLKFCEPWATAGKFRAIRFSVSQLIGRKVPLIPKRACLFDRIF